MQFGPLGISWGKKSQDISRTEDGSYVITASNIADLVNVVDDLLDGHYSPYNLIQLFECIGEIFAPIDEIASRIANAVPQLRKLDNDEVVYDNDIINRLLEQPNPLQNWQQLMYESVVYELVTGMNMLYANVPDPLPFKYKNVSTLWNLPSYAVEMITNNNIKLFSATEIGDIIKAYRVQDGIHSNLEITSDRVLLSKQIDLDFSNRKLKGKSPLLSARKAIKNIIPVYGARNSIYVRRGALGFVVSKKSDASGLQALTKGEREQLNNDFQDSHGVVGTDREGRKKSPLAVTNLPVDFIRVAMSIQELQPFEETEQDAAVIYAVLKVPRELMPKTKENTYANKQQAGKDLYNNVCIPMANSMYQARSNFLKLRDAGYYLHPSFDHVEILQENKKEKSDADWRNNETYRVRFLHGVITLNQWRTKVGEEELSNAMYNKTLFDMTPEELEIVKSVLNTKALTPEKDNNSDDVSKTN